MGDYDYEPKSGNSIFLRLKDKGQFVAVRLASKPYREPVVWKQGLTKPIDDREVAQLTAAQWARIMANPEYEVREAFHWVVIDRDDGRAKIFTGTPMIFKSIAGYANKEQWGDPTYYDVEITRTEEPGRYYTVTPFPDKSIIPQEELAQVSKLKVEDKHPNARKLSDKQIDDITEWLEQSGESVGSSGSDGEPSGYEKAKAVRNKIAKDKPKEPEDDVVIDDIPDGPINLDDIPF